MSSWISIQGKWFPAQEVAQNKNLTKEQILDGDNGIYIGVDRAAADELKKLGVTHLGRDYHLNPELIRLARTAHYDSVDDYLKEMYGYDKEKAKVEQEQLLKDTMVGHDAPEKKPSTVVAAGISTKEGGFGDPEDKDPLTSAVTAVKKQ